MNVALDPGVGDDPVEPTDAPIAEPQNGERTDSETPAGTGGVVTRLARYSTHTRRWHAPVANHDQGEDDDTRRSAAV